MKYIFIFLMNSAVIFSADFASSPDNNLQIFRDSYASLEYVSRSALAMHYIYMSQSLSKDQNCITYTKSNKTLGNLTIVEKALYSLATNSIECRRTTYYDGRLYTEEIEHPSLFAKLEQEYLYHFNEQESAYLSMLHALDQRQPPLVTLKTVTLKPSLYKEELREIELLVLHNDGITTEATPYTCYQYTLDSGRIIAWNLDTRNPAELHELLTMAYETQKKRQKIISRLQEVNDSPSNLRTCLRIYIQSQRQKQGH